jgi:thioredoxin 1
MDIGALLVTIWVGTQNETSVSVTISPLYPHRSFKLPTTLPRPHKEITMASELIKHVSDASFEADVLQSKQPVLVDYWAEWCGPCKMIAPILDEVSTTYAGKLQVTKMNVDENRDIPAKFGIRGIPTLMLFKDGQLAATKVGAMSKAQMTAFIDQQLTVTDQKLA